MYLVPVNLPVVHLQALLGRERRLARGVLAEEGLYAVVDEEVLLQVRLLREVFGAVRADVGLLAVVDLLDVTVEGVLGREDHLALTAVELLRLLVHLKLCEISIR